MGRSPLRCGGRARRVPPPFLLLRPLLASWDTRRLRQSQSIPPIAIGDKKAGCRCAACLTLPSERGREFVPRTAVCHSFKAAFRLSSKGIRRRCFKQTGSGRALSGGVHAVLLLVGSHFISPIQKRLLRREGFSRRRRLFHIASFRAVTIARPSERASLPSSIMALRQIECRRRRRLGGRDAAGRQTFR